MGGYCPVKVSYTNIYRSIANPFGLGKFIVKLVVVQICKAIITVIYLWVVAIV